MKLVVVGVCMFRREYESGGAILRIGLPSAKVQMIFGGGSPLNMHSSRVLSFLTSVRVIAGGTECTHPTHHGDFSGGYAQPINALTNALTEKSSGCN